MNYTVFRNKSLTEQVHASCNMRHCKMYPTVRCLIPYPGHVPNRHMIDVTGMVPHGIEVITMKAARVRPELSSSIYARNLILHVKPFT
jgi:hypothetical protein